MNQHPIPRPSSPPPAGLHTGGTPAPPPRAPRVRLLWERVFPTDPPRRVTAMGIAVIALAAVLLWGVSRALSVSGTGGGAGRPPIQAGSATDSSPAEETALLPTIPEEEATRPLEPATDQDRPPATEPPATEPPATEPPATAPSPEATAAPTESLPDETSAGLPADSAPETAAPRPCPEGCFAVEPLDVSEKDRGPGYVRPTGVTLPPFLPALPPWKTLPAVLLVNTHPYEGYGDGGTYYDPAAGGLALVDTPHAPDGTVALTAALSRVLREMGITVIHLRVSTTAGESAASVHARTEELIQQYCRLYPDVGLVLDIGRSAELTERGGILRTAGSLEGTPCAQLGIGVSGGREGVSFGRDLALALALRQALWEREPTLSRPVEVKTGDGPVPDREEVRVLSLSLGSAGNTFAEAGRLVRPLGSAIASTLQKNIENGKIISETSLQN